MNRLHNPNISDNQKLRFEKANIPKIIIKKLPRPVVLVSPYGPGS
jgi:hypothetical protein